MKEGRQVVIAEIYDDEGNMTFGWRAFGFGGIASDILGFIQLGKIKIESDLVAILEGKQKGEVIYGGSETDSRGGDEWGNWIDVSGEGDSRGAGKRSGDAAGATESKDDSDSEDSNDSDKDWLRG